MRRLGREFVRGYRCDHHAYIDHWIDSMVKTPYIPPRRDREIVWIGSSLKDVSEFDPDLKRAFGFQLRQVQNGEKPSNAKAAEVAGTMKLVEDFDTDTYRVVYTIKLKTAVYVLHAFQKKATSGIATPQRDIDIIRERMKRAAEVDRDREKEQGND